LKQLKKNLAANIIPEATEGDGLSRRFERE